MDLQVHISTERNSQRRMHSVGDSRNGVCVGREGWVRERSDGSKGRIRKIKT